MKITQQTYSTLIEQGIEVKIYPHTYQEFYQKCYEHRYQWVAFWYPEEPQRSKEAKRYAEKDANNWYDADTLYISYGDRLICKKENTKSKEITVEYVLNLVEKDKKLYRGTYGIFTTALQSILKDAGYYGRFTVYPTSYGIGVFVYYNFSLEKDIAAVEGVLKTRGIEYTNEYSDKRWVFRFKISKKQENLDKIFQ